MSEVVGAVDGDHCCAEASCTEGLYKDVFCFLSAKLGSFFHGLTKSVSFDEGRGEYVVVLSDPYNGGGGIFESLRTELSVILKRAGCNVDEIPIDFSQLKVLKVRISMYKLINI